MVEGLGGSRAEIAVGSGYALNCSRRRHDRIDVRFAACKSPRAL